MCIYINLFFVIIEKNPFIQRRATNSDDEALLTERKHQNDSTKNNSNTLKNDLKSTSVAAANQLNRVS